MYLQMALGGIGGLGLFLYGMQLMADGLQKFAGNKLKSIIRSLTRNRLMSVLVGMFVTMVIQSSSATSVMVVGFVNAGIMALEPAAGIIFGANIGTTITGQMVSLNLSQLAPIAVGLGVLWHGLAKSPRQKELAEIFIGFGILFIGMSFLKDALAPLKELPEFTNMVLKYGHKPLFGVGIGLLMTFILQSSSATIGVLIALASQGVLPFSTAIYIIFGDNIGTCTTALISSLGSSRKGKQVAFIHLSINIIGTMYFMLFLTPLLTNIVTRLNPDNVARQIANAHTLFNVINIIILFPFMSWLIKLANWVIPLEEGKPASDVNMTYLDDRILVTPSIAIENTLLEFNLMGLEANHALEDAIKAIQERDKDYVLRVYDHEARVNDYEKAIVEYLVKISQQSVSASDLELVDELFNTANDIERISDHAENIADFASTLVDKDILLDPEVQEELTYIYGLVLKGYALAIDSLTTRDLEKVNAVIEIEREIDHLKIQVRDKHLKRMNKGKASPESGIFVMDLLSNLERISDHFRNIVESSQKIKVFLPK